MPAHFIIKCIEHEQVLSQCKCFSPSKTIQHIPCKYTSAKHIELKPGEVIPPAVENVAVEPTWQTLCDAASGALQNLLAHEVNISAFEKLPKGLAARITALVNEIEDIGGLVL